MNNRIKHLLKFSLCCIGIACIYACSTQKNNTANRKLQNLSARYNYIYNSNVILTEHYQSLAESFQDNYSEILPIYITLASKEDTEVPTVDPKIEKLISKAQTIINEKNFSNYIDDAYLLLGKGNYYSGNYFNATEYFEYVVNTYKKNKPVYLDALNWKARSLMQLNNTKAANVILDSILALLPLVKKGKANPLATLAQMRITQKNYPQAAVYLQQALKFKKSKQDRIRWTYILAQLLEQNKNYEASLIKYNKVVKSNAPFEMYFNANLSKIRINTLLSPIKINPENQYLRLLKDEKNADYIDQIYYQIAEAYTNVGDTRKAEDFYLLSAKNSNKNTYQKAIDYLKIADLEFNTFANYAKAKLYYDSAVTILPKNYPDYENIVKKAQNLQYLADRYQLIAAEDTLQFLASMPEKERNLYLVKKFKPIEILAEKKPLANFNTNLATTDRMLNAPVTGGTFYFSNSTALEKGFSDFKRRWGNRKLTDNWRQSTKSAAQNSQENQTKTTNNTSDLATEDNNMALAASKAEAQIKAITDSLPLTAQAIEKSNQKIIFAYFEIGSFYQQVLNDKNEAIKIYEILLKRFPNNKYLDAIYYSLYLDYADNNPQKSNFYKELVLSNFPSSLYAKIILDPNFSAKQSALEAALNTNYSAVFELYQKADFATVIADVVANNQRFPGNVLEAQFNYLKAIAIGHTQAVDSLISAFNQIIKQYPTDKLIVPLVKDHLQYIKLHLAEFKKRKIALTDFDPNEPRFISQKEVVTLATLPTNKNIAEPVKVLPVNDLPLITTKIPKPVVAQATTPILDTNKLKADTLSLPKPVVAQTTTPILDTNKLKKDTLSLAKPVVAQATTPILDSNKLKTDTLSLPKPVVAQPTIAVIAPAKNIIDNLFSIAESETYYYVIAVADINLSLSSSRFGIGQFNRGNYTGSNLKHQLKELPEDQLIFIGNFSNFNEAKAYAQNISPQLKSIIKIPLANYTAFIVSKENFDKMQDKQTINRYLNFMKKNLPTYE